MRFCVYQLLVSFLLPLEMVRRTNTNNAYKHRWRRDCDLGIQELPVGMGPNKTFLSLFYRDQKKRKPVLFVNCNTCTCQKTTKSLSAYLMVIQENTHCRGLLMGKLTTRNTNIEFGASGDVNVIIMAHILWMKVKYSKHGPDANDTDCIPFGFYSNLELRG